jgi:hypothetical protein
MDFVDQEGNDLNTSFTYRTLPGTGCSDRNIKIAIGGDVGKKIYKTNYLFSIK